MSNDIAIRIENLSKKYVLHHPVKDKEGNESDELWALRDISLEIKKGECVGVFGANGSGKSTLLKILAGITPPTSGRIEIFGRVASILEIGSGFHPELSGRENVFLNGQLLGFKKKEIELRFDEIIEFSGIEKFIDEPVKNYSSGMYLRLAFSIMAHLDFDLYLFDEVMSVGDAEFQLKSEEKIRELKKVGETVVIVSHNVMELSKIAERVIRFENGCLLEELNIKVALEKYMEEAYLSKEKKVRLAISPPYIITEDLPKNEFIEVSEIRITATGKNIEAEIYRDEGIEIFMVIQKKINMHLLAGVFVSDISGNRVISTLSYDSLYSIENKSYIGKAQFKTAFPSYIFNAGLFKFSFVFFMYDEKDGLKSGKRFVVDNILVIKVAQPKSKEDIFINIPGILRPALKWDFIV